MNLELLIQRPQTTVTEAHLPILFVHGAWHGAWCWDVHFLPYFAKHGYAAYALSLRGHGKSERRDKLRWLSIHDYVEDVAQIADTIHHETGRRPLVIGHSMGGFTVQHYLARYEAPGGVLLASAPIRGTIPATLRALVRHPGAVMKMLALLNPYYLIETLELKRDLFFSADMPDAEFKDYAARLQSESFRALLDMNVMLPRPAQVKAPLLVLGAADDSIFTPYEINQTAKAYGVQAEIFPHMAHDMMLERGWQQVADRILTWLESQNL